MEPHDHLGPCVTHGGGDSADLGHSTESTPHHHPKATTRPVRSPSSTQPTSSSSTSTGTHPTLSSAPPSPSLRNIGNPPPRFFTRPHRRSDHPSHHHHHSRDHSLHGSGYSGSQASSSLGVRSAFKDFVVPAQIILACSILNAVWPTVLRVVTTLAEFLVLVLSSYSACASRSDECYFLEPLLQDFDLPEGQEAIYVATIQWSLRILFVGMVVGTVVVLGGKAQKVWWTLKSNRQRPRSFWSPQNMMSWVLACPAVAMAYLQRILPWKITRPSSRNAHPGESRQSPNSHRHRPSLGTPSSTNASSTSISGSQPQPNEPSSTTARRSNYTHAFNALDDNFSAGSGSETRSKSKAKRKSNNRVNTTTVPHIDRNASSSSLLAIDSPSISPSVSSAPSPTPSPSPSPSPLAQPQDTSTTGPTNISTTATNIETTASELLETSATVYEAEDNENDFISTQDRRRRRKAKALRSTSANQSSESITKASPDQREQQHSEPTPLESSKPSQEHVKATSRPLSRDQNQGQGLSLSTTVQANQKESSLSPQSSSFNHPLHALNSTSPIVHLKPTHKRSQSAQLPASSPWSIPYSQSGSTRPFQGSSLSQVSLPLANSTAIASYAPVSSTATANTTTVTSTSTSTSSSDTSKTEQATESGGYGLFGQSSIWYSPFQSGLDITIEGDEPVRAQKLPKPRIQVQSAVQKKPSLGFLAGSSFFESSPRTPRIMPFSQHHANISDDWSVRARSSSIAAPMTPLLESDCADPMDYFGGSRSASSSRRGSVENNLTESLLSGRARMFALSEPNMTNSRPSDLSDLVPSSGSMNNPILNESSFLPHYGSLTPRSSVSAFTNMMSTSLQPSTLDLPTTMGSMPGIFPTEESPPAFVNPWDPPFQYQNHTGSETFLPFGSSTSYDASSKPDEVNHGRQASLLKLMNGDRGHDASGGIHERASSDGLRSLNTFGNGFLLPNRDSLTTTTTATAAAATTTSTLSDSTSGGYPFASIEMSLAAAANQCPVLEEDPKYDFVELAIQSSDYANKKRFDALEGHHSHRGDGHQGSQEKKNRGRHGRTRSGHHKSASLGSFFPPMPNTSSSSSSGLSENPSTPEIQCNSGNTDPLRDRHHQGQGQGQGQGPKQGRRHGNESSLSRENSHVDRRRGTKNSGADSDSNHRSNKHQDTKSKRVQKN
ncbi:hypothetical protein CPB97_002244 [Podila verticillata]|nr:hypothetical protein CPB97_002244 [Podila verticillata]